jgi:hypothetical protein
MQEVRMYASQDTRDTKARNRFDWFIAQGSLNDAIPDHALPSQQSLHKQARRVDLRSSQREY